MTEDAEARRARLEAATAHLDAPFAVLDLGPFDANAADLARRAGGKPIRVASKSLRCRWALDRALTSVPSAGVMAFTLPEALWLAGHGHDDVMVAYPSLDRAALQRLCADASLAATVTILVDTPEHLDAVDAVAPPSSRPPIKVCLDVDASLPLLGGRVRVGALRSPVRTPADAVALAREVVRRPGFVLDGILAYESQVAGLGDDPSFARWKAPAIRALQRRSVRELARRRAAVVAAVREVVGDLRFVNGGGTGSLETTARERAVTEVAAGSGFYGPALFDDYRAFTPQSAALFALPVVRRPGPGVVTLLGGGYPASGPGGPDRLPRPFLPAGLSLTGTEGAGEVQTPVRGAAADDLALGDRVWLRHVKAGELCERFDVLHVIDGDRVVEVVPTYRGEGRTLL
ncbi:MAG TPA: amino acid deaminase/aldolase [Egicoccus sp.]|nr:amino acid deaminase/aldolase [Egicoccus sp.]HSK24741.1 amino acid deaminase/aldolase [Egicoccus sp.]